MSRRTARGAGLTEQAFRCVDDRETHEGNGPTDFHERTIAPLTQCTDHIFGICDKDLRCVRRDVPPALRPHESDEIQQFDYRERLVAYMWPHPQTLAGAGLIANVSTKPRRMQQSVRCDDSASSRAAFVAVGRHARDTRTRKSEVAHRGPWHFVCPRHGSAVHV